MQQKPAVFVWGAIVQKMINYLAIFIPDKLAEPPLSYIISAIRPVPGAILSPEVDAIMTMPDSLLKSAKKPAVRGVVRTSVIVLFLSC